MRIIIGADVVPTESNYYSFQNGLVNEIICDELNQILEESDYVICNLETPITDNISPIDKCGSCHQCASDVINGIKKMNINLFTMANNHIMDQGEKGLQDTIEILESNNIGHVGVGENMYEAAKPYVFMIDKYRIGVYACTEHEFSIIDDVFGKAGANPFDPIDSIKHIEKIKETCDYIIVLYHGGKEYYKYPSRQLQHNCRALIDAGANLVVCQHSHCIGCDEDYNNGKIVYGQGNFIFDDCSDEFEKSSLLIEIADDFSVGYIPIENYLGKIRVTSDNKAKSILDDFYDRGEKIKTVGFIEDTYISFASECIQHYLLTLSGASFKIWFRVLNRLFGYKFQRWYIKKHFSKKNLLAIENYIECEAHRELLLSGIKECRKAEN